MLSGYVDAPGIILQKNYPRWKISLFIPYRDDANTGSDFHKADEKNGTIGGIIHI